MRYKCVVLLLLCLAASWQVFAQEIIVEGKIINTEGFPIEGAAILLLKSGKGTVSKSDGSFSLKVTQKQTERIRISSVGYETVEKTLDWKMPMKIQVSLKPSVKNLDEVVVTGQPQGQTLRNSVYQVRVIDRARIEQRAATNVMGVLNNEIGFRFSNDMALGTTDIQLMGMSGRNVKILLDGVPMLDRGDTRESLNQIDINSIERIEIVEGPMSVNYGTDALAGVINIITKKGNTNHWSLSAKVQEETVANEYGFSKNVGDVWNGIHLQSITGTWQHKALSFSAGLTNQSFGGWQGSSTGRNKEWLPKTQTLANAKLGYRLKNAEFYYRLDGLDEDIVNLGTVNINTNQARDQRFLTTRLMHQFQGNWHANEKLMVNFLAAYTDYQRKTQTSILDLNTGKRTLSLGAGEQDISKFNNAMMRATAYYRWSKLLNLQAGFEINADRASGARIEGSPSINDYALFVAPEINLDSVVLIRPGFRLIKNSVYAAPPLIPALNVKIKLSQHWDWRMAYAQGFRAPALRELYFNFFDASHSIKGNPNLKAENSDSFNASLTRIGNIGKFQHKSTLTGFYNDFRNLISYGTDPTNPSVSQTINIDRFKTTGFTIEQTLATQKLRASLGLSYIGRYNQLLSDESLANTAMESFLWSPEVNTNVSYTLGSGTTLGLFYKFTGKQPAYQATTDAQGNATAKLTEIGSFHWADFTITQKLKHGFQLNAGVKNLANVTRLNNTGTTSGSAHSTSGPVPMSYGRSYFAGITYQIHQ